MFTPFWWERLMLLTAWNSRFLSWALLFFSLCHWSSGRAGRRGLLDVVWCEKSSSGGAVKMLWPLWWRVVVGCEVRGRRCVVLHMGVPTIKLNQAFGNHMRVLACRRLKILPNYSSCYSVFSSSSHWQHCKVKQYNNRGAGYCFWGSLFYALKFSRFLQL
jgi:hypothetical protein